MMILFIRQKRSEFWVYFWWASPILNFESWFPTCQLFALNKLSNLSESIFLHAVYKFHLMVKVAWDQSAWHIVSAQNVHFLHLRLSRIWNTVPLSLLRFLTRLVCSCVQTAWQKERGCFFFLNDCFIICWLRSAAATPCASQGPWVLLQLACALPVT